MDAELIKFLIKMHSDFMDLMDRQGIDLSKYDEEGQLIYTDPQYATGVENKIPNSVDRWSKPNTDKLIPVAKELPQTEYTFSTYKPLGKSK